MVAEDMTVTALNALATAQNATVRATAMEAMRLAKEATERAEEEEKYSVK